MRSFSRTAAAEEEEEEYTDHANIRIWTNKRVMK